MKISNSSSLNIFFAFSFRISCWMDDKLWQVCKLLSSSSFRSVRKMNWFPEVWVNITMVRERFIFACWVLLWLKRISVSLCLFVSVGASKRCFSKEFAFYTPPSTCLFNIQFDFIFYFWWDRLSDLGSLLEDGWFCLVILLLLISFPGCVCFCLT